MKGIKISILIFLMAFGFALSSSEAKAINVYAALGPLYTIPGSLRIGGESWEFGLLAPNALGANKNFKDDWLYYSFGFGSLTYEFSIGPFGAVGFDFNIFSIVNLRGEVNAIANVNGVSSGAIIIGASLNF